MSRVTEVIICSSVREMNDCGSDAEMPQIFLRINKWLADLNPDWQLNMIADHAGGTKWMQMYIAAGAFNHFYGMEDFMEWFKTLQWESPEKVVLIVNEEECPTIVWRPAYSEATSLFGLGKEVRRG
ncbi:hypothetical protein ACYOEI_01110 [Singulisphaera rosea]